MMSKKYLLYIRIIFLSPYSYGAEIKPEFRNMLLNLKELDTLVVLTKEQKMIL